MPVHENTAYVNVVIAIFFLHLFTVFQVAVRDLFRLVSRWSVAVVNMIQAYKQQLVSYL